MFFLSGHDFYYFLTLRVYMVGVKQRRWKIKKRKSKKKIDFIGV